MVNPIIYKLLTESFNRPFVVQDFATIHIVALFGLLIATVISINKPMSIIPWSATDHREISKCV